MLKVETCLKCPSWKKYHHCNQELILWKKENFNCFELFWSGQKNELPSIIIYIWKGFYIGKKAFLNNMGKKLHFTVENLFKNLHTLSGIY